MRMLQLCFILCARMLQAQGCADTCRASEEAGRCKEHQAAPAGAQQQGHHRVHALGGEG